MLRVNEFYIIADQARIEFKMFKRTIKAVTSDRPHYVK